MWPKYNTAMMSIEDRTAADLCNAFKSADLDKLQELAPTPNMPWLSDPKIWLYTVLLKSSELACTSLADSTYTPVTQIGKVATMLSASALLHGLTQSDGIGACWELEPRLLKSVAYARKNQLPREEPALIFINPDGSAIGYQKHNGSAATLVLREHPYFSNVPSGTFVDSNIPGRLVEADAVPTRNPAINLQLVNDGEPHTPAQVMRLSTFILSPRDRQLWNYNPHNSLARDKEFSLTPHAAAAGKITLKALRAEVQELAEQLT